MDSSLISEPGTVPSVGGDAGSGKPASRLPSLTGLRFAAALIVFVYHQSLPTPTLRLLSSNSTAGDFYHYAQPAGALGVAFFFVLSGFILTWSAKPGDTAGRFWRRRFVKIYPNYVVAWLLAMLLFAGSTTSNGLAVSNLLMLHVWVPSFNDYLSVDPPSWSLGVEVLFYAAFPLLLVLIRRIDPQRLKYWIGGVAAGIIATPLIATLTFSSTPAIPIAAVSDLQYWFTYILPPVRILDFALGILVARAVMTGRWRNIGMAPSSLLLAGSFVLAVNVPYLYAQRSMCIIPIALLIAAVATADVEGRFTPFRNRAMVWLGNVSFAFYLLHFIVLRTTRLHLGVGLYSIPDSVAIMMAELAGTIVVSALLYTLVERPIVHRWSNPRRSHAPVIEVERQLT